MVADGEQNVALPGTMPGQLNRPEVYDRLPVDALREALRKMRLIRQFEEGAEQAYMRGLIHGTMHLSIGQEASAMGICAALQARDKITSTHRGHGHCIAKGADPKLMFAEFFGKETGYCRGRGGSMHIADVSQGNLGANGIVGGGLPIAVGAALALKQQRRDDVVVCFFGDGASNQGAFHEALNMAAIWKLAVIFVCENNKYGMSTSTEQSMSVKNVADRGPAYAIPSVIVDGNVFSEVAGAAFTAVARGRAGEGPTLIESKTYRIRGHSRSDRNRYRTKDEIEQWSLRDPIVQFEKELQDFGLLTEEDAISMTRQVEQEIAAGIDFAQRSPAPKLEDLLRDVYSQA